MPIEMAFNRSRKSRLHAIGLAFLLAVLSTSAATRANEGQPISPSVSDEKFRVVYPNIDGGGADNFGYRVLQLALAKSGTAYHAELFPISMNHDRAREMLESGTISICDFGTSAAYENKFRAIYFPLDRGLNGLRLLMVMPDTESRLANMKVRDLFTLKLGQGYDWSDTEILEQAGFSVSTGPGLARLFPMLQAGRFDALPLGVDEIYEMKARYARAAPGAIIDRYFVIRYQFARMFFVKRNNTELADAVMQGLERAFSDGSFQAIFRADHSYSEALKLANLASRKMIVIDSPQTTNLFSMMPEAYFLPASQSTKTAKTNR
jgi:hypothetical protein